MDIIKPLTAEAIALNEKKMNMTLDDIIKMSKKTVSKVKRTRILNKSRGFLNRGSSRVNSSLKVQKFNNSRSSLRQSVLAQKRANFRGDKFPVATGAARKVVQTPIRNKGCCSYASSEEAHLYLEGTEAADVGLAVCRHERKEARGVVVTADERRRPVAATDADK